MREFILRARRGPTTPDFSLDDLSRAGRLEIVAHCIANALFCANRLRSDVTIHIVLDGPSDPPKAVRLESGSLGSIGGFDERSLCQTLQDALGAGRGIALGEEVQAPSGAFVAKKGFETLVRERAAHSAAYVLSPRGPDIREVEFSSDSTFVFTDHLSMPKKTAKYLRRIGLQPISVGPRSLFASQCVVLVHNELDRQGIL
ncbi:MAG: tRNA (pseudouridine(54)-N(1))-methyltransferase TrmY [Candidatus Latescibacteria bacterium]|jgi:tRNA (pseudouridine54-N1)-methyltransferase|nr:tRNA (pseudouridine(54)-N(1))-methyltransferase TrmY [Candidatus Latescibacterota bacterium]